MEGGILTGLESDDGVVKALQHALGTDLVGDALGSGVLEDLTILGAFEVDDGDVTLGGGTIHLGVGGEALTQQLDLLVDVLVGNSEHRHLGGDLGGVGNLEVRTHVHLGGELDEFTILQLGDVDLGLVQGNDLVVLDGLVVGLRESIVDGLLQHGAAAEALVNHRGGNLALAKAGNAHLGGDVLVGLVESGLELIKRHRDGELHPGGAELLEGAGHERSPEWSDISSAGWADTCSAILARWVDGIQARYPHGSSHHRTIQCSRA